MTIPLIAIISGILMVGPVVADHHEGDMDHPEGMPEDGGPIVILGPPEGFEPAEDEMPEMPEDPEEAKALASGDVLPLHERRRRQC